MNFASYEFWKLLFLCFIGSRLVIAATRFFPKQTQASVSKICLFATALILLGSESWLTLGAFLWIVLLGWLSLLLQPTKIANRFKNLIFLLLLAAQLAPLFYYKYWNFLINETFGLDLRNPSLLIPMGLSFYTFQTIGLWVDNLRNPQPRPKFLDYLNFSSFFPQIVAGPIEKRESLLPQIESTHFRIHRENIDPALRWIVLGLAYKLIVADNLGTLSQSFQPDFSNAWHTWLECFSFAMRIYFDFAGYSFIAIGLGLIFGVKLTLNFRSPYWASDMREFWRKWHITLGAWLRDYVYIPLGGNRTPLWLVNTLIAFLISGIWHGAGWGFMIWGLLHGIGVAFSATGKKWEKLGPIRWLVTFTYTTATWLFFFEQDSAALREKALSFINPSSYSLLHLKQLPDLFSGPSNTLTTACILLIAIIFLIIEKIGLTRKTEPYAILRTLPAALTLVILTVLLAPMEESSFIYFNF